MRNKNKNKRKIKEICGKPCLTGDAVARAMVCCRAKDHSGKCGAWGFAQAGWWENK